MLDTKNRKSVEYFTGIEVEHTPHLGQKTLFVVGVKPYNDIVTRVEQEGIKHIYLGTSQSFNPADFSQWSAWDRMIVQLLKNDFFVTLDFDVAYSETVLEYSWNEYENFTAMISVKLPNIRQYNYSATLKIDDVTWGHSNPGVWSYPLHDMLKRESFTPWHAYAGDKTQND
jgi:hypothetical protein